MSVETELYTLLTSESDITDLVGTAIYPYVIPQDVSLPAIVYQQIAGVPGYTADGQDNLTPYELQVTCWDNSYSDVRELATKTKAALTAYSGGNIDVIYITGEGDIPSLEGDRTRFGKRIDIRIWYKS